MPYGVTLFYRPLNGSPVTVESRLLVRYKPLFSAKSKVRAMYAVSGNLVATQKSELGVNIGESCSHGSSRCHCLGNS